MLFVLLQLSMIALVLASSGCTDVQRTPADLYRTSPAPAVLRDLPAQVRGFISHQEDLARALAGKLGVELDSATVEYFTLARGGQYRAASQIYQDFRERGGKVESVRYDPSLRLPLWDPLLEVQLTLDAYAAGASRFATALGEEIVESMPPGSIYFGGTDTGRGLVAAFSRGAPGGKRLVVVSQNQLINAHHADYLRAAFGDRISMFSADDFQSAFQRYVDDAKRRYQHDQMLPTGPRQLRPGENVTMAGDRVLVTGQVCAMMVNALLTQMLFERNPDREFYVEESFPLDWMYPHLAPYGFILKIQREPVAELSSAVIEENRAFWSERLDELMGDWLKPETSVQQVCDFVEGVFHRKDLSSFTGDREFVGNYYATAACSKLRASQAGVYAWRAQRSQSAQQKQRMFDEADFAFRQSFAICPSNTETVFRYVTLLVQSHRPEDALRVVRGSLKLKPSAKELQQLLIQVENLSKGTRE